MDRTIKTIGVLIVLVAGITGLLIFWSTESDSVKEEFQSKNQECLSQTKGIVAYIQAVQTGNLRLCEKSDEPELCRAVLQKNESFCDEYADEKESMECRAKITKDEKLCGTNNVCRAEVLQKAEECADAETSTEEICEILAGNTELYEQQCAEKAWKRLAMIYLAPKLCNNIVSAEKKEECIIRSQ